MTPEHAPRPQIRLFVEAPLSSEASVALEPAQAHYLRRVMRLGEGDRVALFNGRDGEWRARLGAPRRTEVALIVEQRTRAQASEPPLHLAFAPLKRAPLHMLVEKATELGATHLWPVTTKRTAVVRVNNPRLRAQAIEAAEQCGRLTVPHIGAPVPLVRWLDKWPRDCPLLLLDETGGGLPIKRVLETLPANGTGSVGMLCGPEGGFTMPELDATADLPFVYRVDLGPRTLRAETAALAALACWQAWRGDGATISSAEPGSAAGC